MFANIAMVGPFLRHYDSAAAPASTTTGHQSRCATSTPRSSCDASNSLWHLCAVKDISPAYEIRQAYPQNEFPVYKNVNRLYCNHCNQLILRLGERCLFYYCQKCRDRSVSSSARFAAGAESIKFQRSCSSRIMTHNYRPPAPYCLCATCNDQFRMSLVAYQMLNETTEREHERARAEMLARTAAGAG
ncbi:unnamed protein product [Amoebophrya sp. A120]|nr:unnamed protein product [Amoebophrya sp. A120]|eukprot:GSA120T00006914001.1